MWRFVNDKLNVWLLGLIRVFNLIAFIAVIFYIGRLITGYDLAMVILALNVFWSALTGWDKDFISIGAKKIMTLEWGFSFLIFIVFLMFLWDFRWSYIKNFKKLCQKIL